MKSESFGTSVRLAVHEAAKGLRSQPHIQTTWASALRRSVVVVAFIAAGLAFGDLGILIGGAFGALQVGYADISLPRPRLVGYLALNSLAVGIAVLVSGFIGDTWGTVPWVIALGLLAGALSHASALWATPAFNALVLGIVFSGVTLPPGGALGVALWVLAGGVAQSVVWILWWPWDRRSRVNLQLANDLEAVRRMLLRKGALGTEVAESAGVEAALQAALRSARLPASDTEQALTVAAWVALTRRAAIAWIEVADPSLAERQSLADTLHSAQQVARGQRREWVPAEVSPGYACVSELQAALRGLRESVHAWRDLPTPHRSAVSPQDGQGVQARRPSLAWRHAIRVAAAVGLAQVLSLPVASDHSFWIPLTVAFILKPDWAYTVLRTLLRLIGTVAAVMLFGYVTTWLIDHPVTYVLVAFLLVLITLRWMTGNYAIAAFAVSGFVLLVDSSVDSGADLPLQRLAFTLVGSLVGLMASLLVPNWVSRDVPSAVRGVLTSLRDGLPAVLPAHSRPTAAVAYEAGLQVRDALEHLRIVAVGTALEPRNRAFSTAALLDLLDRGQVVLTRLWALGTYEFMSARNGSRPPVPQAVIARIEAGVDRAASDAGVQSPMSLPSPSGFPDVMARTVDEGMSGQVAPLTQEEVLRVSLLVSELERDVVAMLDSVRHLSIDSESSRP